MFIPITQVPIKLDTKNIVLIYIQKVYGQLSRNCINQFFNDTCIKNAETILQSDSTASVFTRAIWGTVPLLWGSTEYEQSHGAKITFIISLNFLLNQNVSWY